jgi:DsbC/DsbD-like thiol-disulfide interchange protein
VDAVAPGDRFHLGVLFEIQDTWHMNWSNPGDAGLAPAISWKLPEGWHAGVLQWPHPERFETGPLAIFGYAGEVLLFTEVSVPDDAKPGSSFVIEADASWLACQDACVPGEGAGSVRITVAGKSSPGANAELFAQTERLVPAPAGPWRFDAWLDGDDRLQIDIASAAPGHELSGDVFFYPDESGLIEYAEQQKLSRHARAYSRHTGVVVTETGWGPGTGPALRIDVPLSPNRH